MRATRITYVGELGWELYVPTETALGVYDDLLAAGTDLGLRDAGYYAIESLRLEKAYRAFGRELTPDHSPVEAGLLFACKLRTDIDFLGRAAVERGPRAWATATAGVVRGRRPASRCCGAASWCCATASRSGRSPARRGARPSAAASGWPTSPTRPA